MGKKSPPSRKPGSLISPATFSPSLVMQNFMTWGANITQGSYGDHTRSSVQRSHRKPHGMSDDQMQEGK